MHTIQIRNVPDEVYQKLSEAAKSSHRSLAGHVLHMLETAVDTSALPSAEALFRDIVMVREDVAKRYGSGPSSVENIREDRSR